MTDQVDHIKHLQVKPGMFVSEEMSDFFFAHRGYGKVTRSLGPGVERVLEDECFTDICSINAHDGPGFRYPPK